MKLLQLALGILALAGLVGCTDDTSGPADDAGDADVVQPDEAADRVEAEDAPAEDTVDTADMFSCPDVTPEDETLTFETVAVVGITLMPPGPTQLSVAICRYVPPFAWATRLATSGSCRVLHWLPMTAIPTADDLETGDITVEIDGTAVPIAAPDPATPCYRPAVGTIPDIAVGDTIRAWSTGGADVAAFDLSMVVPDAPAMTTPVRDDTFTACTPWTLAWTPADAADVHVQVRASFPADVTDFAISCRGLSTSPMVLPAELTTLWPAELPRALAEISVEPEVVSTTEPPVTLRVTSMRVETPVSIARP